MKYQDVRQSIETGDVFLVEGRSIISKIIRAFTGESYSHVGLLIWIGDTLWVAEYKEFIGFRFVPASLWIEDVHTAGARAWLGRAPAVVTMDPPTVYKTALKWRGGRYGYLSLGKIWISQLFNLNLTTRRLVCSTFVQKCWESVGIKFFKTADPGDIATTSGSLTLIHKD